MQIAQAFLIVQLHEVTPTLDYTIMNWFLYMHWYWWQLTAHESGNVLGV